MANKFKAVEMGIFAVVSLIFLNSVYNLFTDGKFIGDGERRPLAAYKDTSVKGPTETSSEKPASKAGATDGLAGFAPYETKCAPTGEVFETAAAKVRILGPFCGLSGRNLATDGTPRSESNLTDFKVENSTSHYTATVFSDHSAGKFSTDFIPLEPGPNKIMLEFRYKGGKVYPIELTVVRK